LAKTQRVVDFLQSLPFVDPQAHWLLRTVLRRLLGDLVPPLVDRLAAVVVAGHFNDWRRRSRDVAPSYLLHPDEDFYKLERSESFHPCRVDLADVPAADMH